MNTVSRLKLIGFLCLFIPVLVIGKLTILQTIRYQEFAAGAQKRVYTKTKENVFRGRILDRNGKILAESLRSYAIAVTKNNVKDKKLTLSILADVLHLDLTLLKARWEGKTNFFYVKKNATPLEYEELLKEIRNNKLSGIEIEPRYTRIYPYGVAQDIIGSTNSENIGFSGIELMYNDVLADKKEGKIVKKARDGGIIYEAGQEQSNEAADVYLTIDALGQYFTEETLKYYAEKYKVKNAFALVQDPDTGDVLAAASYPYRDGQSLPFQFIYEPGSTFKTIAVAAALDTNTIKENDSYSMDNNKYNISGIIIRDHQDKPSLNVTEILEVSSNIGAAKIATEVGAKNLYTYFKKFGFGIKSNVNFLSESSGILRDHTSWKPIDTAKAGYGYTVSASGIQIVGAYSAIANGGALMQAHLISKIKYPSGREDFLAAPMRVRQVLKPNTVKILKKMLISVVENGTAKSAKMSAYEVAGKTGTTEKLMETGKYERRAHIASFCGFVPADRPRLTILVVLDEPEKSLFGSVSAKIFSDIAAKFLTLYPEVNENSYAVKY